MELRKSTAMEIYRWFWSHLDINVSWSLKPGFVGMGHGVISFLITILGLFA
ncbi:MAG: hypothetical protein HOG41_14585 [Gammaproteobacteria bacterium]|nr:hypothetical protein [Gammaproteobacteria bacterium]MBT4077333.1 hypothetical protein [Gammaproteobacteria bacterium]MBT7047325.1 hypothetical protein [Gammaproteobacteria bacterium]